MVDLPRLVLQAGLQLLRAPSGAVDWEYVTTYAANVGDAKRWGYAEKQQFLSAYETFVNEPTPQIIELTELRAPSTHRIRVFDRFDWIKTNVKAFAEQLEPLQNALAPKSGSLVRRGMHRSNQVISTVALGLLLGHIAKRVLGQYDPSLFGREILTGEIYFVEPNIETVEQELSFVGNDFRRWIAIHEVTHAIVFESVPWLKGHLSELLRRYLAAAGKEMNSESLKSRARAVTSHYVERRQFSLIDAVLSSEQIELLSQIQALMCVIEGYSDFVMGKIGKEQLATYDQLKRAFELRRRRKTGRERFFERATGLGMKMEQYVLGERFVSYVTTSRGIHFVNKVWRAPSDVPTLDEVSNPQKWIERQERKR